MRNYDLEFLKRFSMVIGFLAAVTLVLILGINTVGILLRNHFDKKKG